MRADHIELDPAESSANASAATNGSAWLAANPFVPVAAGLAAGVMIEAHQPMPAAMWILLGIASILALLIRRADVRVGTLIVVISAMAAGGLRYDLAVNRWAVDHIAGYCRSEPIAVRLTGTVLQAPLLRETGHGVMVWQRDLPRTRFQLAAESLAGQAGPVPVSGTVIVVVREPALHVAAGDRVEIFGKLFSPRPPMNPGEFDFASASRRQGILAYFSCERVGNVKVLETPANPQRWLDAARQRARAVVLHEAYLGHEPGAGLLTAMVLGQRTAVDPALNDAFIATGTVHYLSVSGAHVALLASVVWLAGALAGIPRRKSALLVLLIITAYGSMVETQPPIIRAVCVGNLMCAVVWFRRPLRSANWLALAAAAQIVWQPGQLFDPGFQLSFLGVLSIIFVSPAMHGLGVRFMDRLLGRDDPLLMPAMQARINPPSAWRRRWQRVLWTTGWALAVSIAAWLSSVLVVAGHFHRISPWGWLCNLPVMPLIGVVEMVGLLKAALGWLVPPAGAPLGWVLATAADALIGMVSCMARWPGASLAVPAVPGWLSLSGLGLLAWWVVRQQAVPRQQAEDAFLADVADDASFEIPDNLPAPAGPRWPWFRAVALAYLIILAWRMAPPAGTDQLRLTVLSVGSGSSCVLQLPNGRTVINDAGCMPLYDMYRYTLGPFLAHRRVNMIDQVLLSHANLDHFAAVPDLLAAKSVGGVIAPPHFTMWAEEKSLARRLMEDVRERGVPWHGITRGASLQGTGEVAIDVLWPPTPAEYPLQSVNDTGLVLSIRHAGHRVLICGDIEEIPQAELLRTTDLKADVLVLPHHGSLESTTADFVRAVDPTWCIRSSGKRDAESKPELLEMVRDRRYHNTAEEGAIEIMLGPAGVEVHPYRPAVAQK